MKLLNWYLSLTRARQIGVSVGLAHLLLVFALCIHHLATSRRPPIRPIAVRTRIPTAPPQLQQRSASPQKTAPSKTTSAKPSQTTPKPQTPKAKAPPAKTTKSIQPAKKPADDRILKEIAESLEQISAPSPAAVPQSRLSLPSLLAPKTPLEQQEENGDETYGEFLIGYLQSALDLPEIGEVMARIEITRDGKLASCEILSSRSRKNSEFLKNRLPELAYPCFNDFRLAEPSLHFTITFRNADAS